MALIAGTGNSLTQDNVPGDGTAAGTLGQEAADNIARQADLDIATLIQTGLQIAQLIIYYNLLDDAIDARDAKIDAQIAWMQELEDYKETQDLPMLNLKASVLTDLAIPSVNMCSDAVLNTSDSRNDGEAVDSKGVMLSEESCSGIPQGWGIHDGTLMGAKSGSYVGGLVANNAKRRQESFRVQKTRLVRAGQQGMKAVYNASDTLAMYAQAAAIHSGFADLFIQGFNSAGTGLGVSLGRLAGSSTNSAAGTDGTNPSTNVGTTNPSSTVNTSPTSS